MSFDRISDNNQEYLLRRNALRLEILHEISISLTQLDRPEQVVEKLINLLPGIFDVRACGILLSDDSNILKPQSALGVTMDSLSELTNALDKATLQTTKAMCLDKPALTTVLNFEQLLLVPLICNNHSYGLLALFDRESRTGVIPFSEEDIGFVESLASIAAVALHNAKLFSNVMDEKLEKEAIFNSSPVAIISTDIKDRIVSFNRIASENLGFSAKQIKQRQAWQSVIKGIPCECPFSARNIAVTVPIGDIKGDINIVPLFDHSKRKKGTLITIQDISESHLIREMFQRFVSESVVNLLLEEPERMNLGGELRNVTILFSDLRDFTKNCYKQSPEQTVWILNEYFAAMVEILLKHNGTVDKLIGDGIMALFGAPVTLENDTVIAVNCALEMMQAIDKVNQLLRTKNLPELAMGIGIDSGTVIAGIIGTPNIMTYTVIGNSANLSNRLCTSARPHEILITETVYNCLPDKSCFTKLQSTFIKGIPEPVVCYSSLTSL